MNSISLPTWLRWLAIPLGLLVFVVVAISFIDEPLRAYAEREMNNRLSAYTVQIGALDLHPLTLSLDIERIVVSQKDHPDPPLAHIAKIHGSLQWRALLSGSIVTDQMIEQPIIHFTRPQATKEVEASPEHQQSWQELLFTMQEVKLNELRITHGEITYRDHPTSRPLHMSELNVRAENIRNVRSASTQYPSHLQIDMRVFDEGRFVLEGQADFFAEPFMAVNAEVTLKDIPLTDVAPLTAQRQVYISQGVLSAEGLVEYAPTAQRIRFTTLSLQDVKADFVHSAKTKEKEKDMGKKVAKTADKVSNHPSLLVRIDRGKIESSEFGLVNTATDPSYRVFIAETHIELENWSNQLSEGTALVRLTGLCMGSGDTQISGAFRPESKSPDFDLSVKIRRTPIKSFNELLRAYGGLDAASGVFSVYSEMTVKHGKVNGYLKPLFKDVKAYDAVQDQDKGLLQKIFEKTVNVAAALLQNIPRHEVATKTDLSGPVENPQANTWEMVVTLFQNAFFDAVLPGLEGRLRKSS
ncbi:MAG: DUF748 domain-containing protein [Nitrospira sp.]